jgi:restriction system protein
MARSRHRRTRPGRRLSGAGLVIGGWIWLAQQDGGPGHGLAAAAASVILAAAAALVLLWTAHRTLRGRVRLPAVVSQVDGLTGPEFEQVVGALYRRDGYTRVVAGGGAGDLGLDVLAYAPAETPRLAVLGRWLTRRDGRRVVTQCKRYATTNTVGSGEIQAFLGTYRYVHEADVGVFVTSSTFTAAARRLGESQGLLLVDRPILAAWLDGTPLRLPAPRRLARDAA